MPKKVTKKKDVTSAGGKSTGGDNKSRFKKSPRNFRIGEDIQPKRNLTIKERPGSEDSAT